MMVNIIYSRRRNKSNLSAGDMTGQGVGASLVCCVSLIPSLQERAPSHPSSSIITDVNDFRGRNCLIQKNHETRPMVFLNWCWRHRRFWPNCRYRVLEQSQLQEYVSASGTDERNPMSMPLALYTMQQPWKGLSYWWMKVHELVPNCIKVNQSFQWNLSSDFSQNLAAAITKTK
ncbi:hypothetical protein BDN70DRAFT_76781 [Pholiota conissans]|uniref:Uncharacterized protein n=1 Tax=Pholiota conissans TaxID=109636 RepID=A0A9P5Z1D8_9AGAR|nr:hypothetical protein BDN70DRAFT_76781 [Pholiota conissans]